MKVPTSIAGADGCRLGWVAIRKSVDTNDVHLTVHRTAQELIAGPDAVSLLCVDIPIGLPDRGKRECDVAARKILGRPRGSSVFPAPIRPAVSSPTREEASQVTSAADGRKVSAQSFAIYPKILEIDALLSGSPELQSRVLEVHPEVCFWAFNRGKALQDGKKTRVGHEKRKSLVSAWLGRDLLDRLFVHARQELGLRKKDLADDDVLDAAIALWTAERVSQGTSVTLPAAPETDSAGMKMQIVY